MSKRVLVIDGDTLIYAAGTGCEQAIQWSAWEWTLHADFNHAKATLDAEIARLRERLDADEAIIALSDDKNFRKKVLPTYKANRTGTRKPVVHGALREYAFKVHKARSLPTLEGDDVLGILLTDPSLNKGREVIAVSIDKDMVTVPGLHFNYGRAEDASNYLTLLRDVEEWEADRNHMMQTLTGDRVDGYAGCKGIGPVKAEAILAGMTTYEEMWPAVVAAYEKSGLTEKDALATARVARILRYSDYDQKKGKVKLWKPPA